MQVVAHLCSADQPDRPAFVATHGAEQSPRPAPPPGCLTCSHRACWTNHRDLTAINVSEHNILLLQQAGLMGSGTHPSALASVKIEPESLLDVVRDDSEARIASSL